MIPADCSRQHALPFVAGRVRVDCTGGHRRRRGAAGRDHLLPGVLRPRISGAGEVPAAPRPRVPRARVVRHRGGGGARQRGGGAGHRARHRRGAACLGPGHQSRRHRGGLSGQGADRPVRGGHLHARRGPAGFSSRARSPSASPSATKGGATRKRCAGRHVAAPTWSSTRTITRPMRTATGRPRSRTRPTPSTRRPTLCRAAENTCYFATRQLRRRRVADHVRRGAARRHAAGLPALWPGGVARGRHRSQRRHRPAGSALAHGV